MIPFYTALFDGRTAADEPLYSGVDLLRFPALRGGFPTYIRALRRNMVVFATGRLMCFAARSALDKVLICIPMSAVSRRSSRFDFF